MTQIFNGKRKIKRCLLNKIIKYTWNIKNPRNKAIKFLCIHEKLNLVSERNLGKYG